MSKYEWRIGVSVLAGFYALFAVSMILIYMSH